MFFRPSVPANARVYPVCFESASDIDLFKYDFLWRSTRDLRKADKNNRATLLEIHFQPFISTLDIVFYRVTDCLF